MAEYMTRREVGVLINIDGPTVTLYMRRYAGSATPFPAPDLRLGHIPGWRADRADEIRAWAASRPGRKGRTTREAPPATDG
jgi:hypothetical protein